MSMDFSHNPKFPTLVQKGQVSLVFSGELEDKSILAVDQKASREKTGRSEVVLIHYKKQVS